MMQGHLPSMGPNFAKLATSDAITHIKTHDVTPAKTEATARNKQDGNKQVHPIILYPLADPSLTTLSVYVLLNAVCSWP
jgi:hypothetical protein